MPSPSRPSAQQLRRPSRCWLSQDGTWLQYRPRSLRSSTRGRWGVAATSRFGDTLRSDIRYARGSRVVCVEVSGTLSSVRLHFYGRRTSALGTHLARMRATRAAPSLESSSRAAGAGRAGAREVCGFKYCAGLEVCTPRRASGKHSSSCVLVRQTKHGGVTAAASGSSNLDSR